MSDRRKPFTKEEIAVLVSRAETYKRRRAQILSPEFMVNPETHVVKVFISALQEDVQEIGHAFRTHAMDPKKQKALFSVYKDMEADIKLFALFNLQNQNLQMFLYMKINELETQILAQNRKIGSLQRADRKIRTELREKTKVVVRSAPQAASRK